MIVTFKIPIETMCEDLVKLTKAELKDKVKYFLSESFLCSEEDIKILNLIKEK